MKKEPNLIMAFVLVFLIQGCTKQKSSNEFILNGTFVGSNTSHIILKYIDDTEKLIKDTVSIKDNKFSVKGSINGATYVGIEGNRKSRSSEDPNSVWFFLEPKRIDISLAENKFKKVVIKGSGTQKEYEELRELVQPIYSRIKPLMVERNKLSESARNDEDSIVNRINYLDHEWRNELNKIKQLQLKFALDNPNSYLSAFLTDKYFKSIPYDSTKIYYGNLNRNIKESLYGKRIFQKIQKRKPNMVGDNAPDFKAINSKGEEVDLMLFRGKYILIDFWASWCKPCRESVPGLQKLYRVYHDKGLEIIGVSLDDYKTDWEEAITEDNTDNWIHIYNGRKGPIVTKYNINEIPDYILIDKRGYIIGRKSSNKKFGFNELEKIVVEIFGDK